MKSAKKRNSRGFTLIEVLTTVLIVGIIGAVAYGLYILVLQRATEDIIALELRGKWDEMRATAAVRNVPPAGVAIETIEDINRTSQFLFELETTPPSIVGWETRRDNPICVRMIIPDSPEVESAPIGECEKATYDAFRRQNLDAWWPLNDTEGSGSASGNRGNGPNATAVGVTFEQEAASLHAEDTDEDYGATFAAGHLVFQDDDGVTSPLNGLTMGLYTTTNTGGTTLFHAGSATEPLLRGEITATGQASCISDSVTATSNSSLDAGQWNLVACRLHPNGNVSVVVNGTERGRASFASPEDIPDWSSGPVYPAGYTDGTLTGGVDHVFISGNVMSDSLLRSLYQITLTETPDTP